MSEQKHYHDRDQRDLDMNRRVAQLLGWHLESETFAVTPEQHYRWLESSRGMFGAPDMPVPSPGVHHKPVWVSPDGRTHHIVQDDDWFTLWALPEWSTDLNKAWQLMVDLNLSIPFDPSWLLLPSNEVAYRICEQVVRQREAT